MLRITKNCNKCNCTDNDNIMYFDNDDDFAVFCMNPNIQIYTTKNSFGQDIILATYDFSNQYKNAVTNGIKFCIQDEKSRVNKDGLLGFRNCTKQVSNIEPYYGV